MSDSAEVAVATPATGTLETFRTMYDPDLDFRKLAGEATYFSRGFRLVEKDDLIDIPHVVIAVTYREGYLREENGKQVQGDYVSVEAVVADAQTLMSPQVRSKVDVDSLAVYPNEAVVYNDGGTGIRRELTKLFDDIGMIDVGGTGDDERRYDRPYSLWREGGDAAQAGFTVDRNGEKFRYFSLRGLRKSEYDSPFGPAVTFYFG